MAACTKIVGAIGKYQRVHRVYVDVRPRLVFFFSNSAYKVGDDPTVTKMMYYACTVNDFNDQLVARRAFYICM